MKKLLLFYLLSLFALTSCDKVKNPRETSTQLSGSNFIEKDNYALSGIKKVLLEDYTGHTCGNCPKAATKAEELLNIYKDTLIVVAVHAGSFADPTSAYPADYRTPAGTDWDNFFGISAAGLPKGMINRKGYPTTTHIYSYTQWASVIPSLIRTSPNVIIKMKTQYDTVNRVLNVLHNIKFQQNFSNDIYLNTILIEDSIVGKQKDYSVYPDDVENYVFHNMLRGALNGSWGVVAKSAPINANDSITKNINGFYVNPAFNDKKLYVVSFVYDNVTKEVIQCEKVKIR
ncbi:MAG TPA: Omp28 family outer membrane lipoprotein [Bacteroidia bacterium]|nr:Omp28 family outer membrane lipoprotein [Bacteroidia bacterium]